MGRGSSKGGGGGALAAEARERVKGVTGYNITRADGGKMEMFFRESGGETYYSNDIGELPTPTPNGWTAAEMIARIEQNGGTATKYTKAQLVKKETERLEARRQTDELLNREYARNRHADANNKAYRNTRRAQRIARRS